MNQETANFVTFTHETARFKCKPETVARIRATLEKMPKHKFVALSTKNLARQYPSFLAGDTTTADYVERFNSQFEGRQFPVTFYCENYYGLAPMLNPLFPEVVEETDPDYIEPAKPSKAKKPSAGEYRAACVTALECLNRGDTVTAQLALLGVLGND